MKKRGVSGVEYDVTVHARIPASVEQVWSSWVDPKLYGVIHGTHRSEIDLVITDLMMPKRGGSWLLEALQEMQIPAKVLVVTGYFDLPEDMGLDHDTPLLRKPWAIPELLVKVRETLDAQVRSGES